MPVESMGSTDMSWYSVSSVQLPYLERKDEGKEREDRGGEGGGMSREEEECTN